MIPPALLSATQRVSLVEYPLTLVRCLTEVKGKDPIVALGCFEYLFVLLQVVQFESKRKLHWLRVSMTRFTLVWFDPFIAAPAPTWKLPVRAYQLRPGGDPRLMSMRLPPACWRL